MENFSISPTRGCFLSWKPPEALHKWILEMKGCEDDHKFNYKWPHLMSTIEKVVHYIYRDAYHESWCAYQKELYHQKLGFRQLLKKFYNLQPHQIGNFIQKCKLEDMV